MKKRIRVGVLGTGPWGRNIHQALVRDLGDRVTIPWVLGRNATDEDGILDFRLAAIDALVIAIPPAHAKHLTLQALVNGVAVFLEKPMALDILSAEEIHDAAIHSNTPILVNHVQLWDPAYAALRRWVEEGNGIRSMICTAKGGGPWRDWGKNSGLWDWGPHAAAWAVDLLGLPDTLMTPTTVRVDAAGGRVWRVEMHYRPNTRVMLEFGNGAETKLRELAITSARGDHAMVHDGLLTLSTSKDVAQPAGPPPLTAALTTFLDAIDGKSDARMGTQLGFAVVKMLARCESLFNERRDDGTR